MEGGDPFVSADTTWPSHAFEQGVLARPFHMRLRALIAEQHLTHKAVAEMVGVSPKHMNQLLSGYVPMSPRLALQLERVLGVPAERLYIWQGLTQLANLRQTSQHSG